MCLGLEKLKNLTALEVDVRHNNVGVSGAEDLLNVIVGLKKLKKLDLSLDGNQLNGVGE